MPITAQEYAERRARLMEQMHPASLAILPGATERFRNADVAYPFRQDSDFLYLCGFAEPESLLVLAPQHEEGEFLLFCRPRDPQQERWEGAVAGPEGARERFQADRSFPIDELEEVLLPLLAQREHLYYPLGRAPALEKRLGGWMERLRQRPRSGRQAPHTCIDLARTLHELRLVKSPAEQALMEEAGRISAGAHRRAMQYCRPGLMEYHLEAELLHEFLGAGCRAPAYPCIVGGGPNGCILHYGQNDRELRDGELVLIDAGCEWQHYAADITRTFPVNGRFRPEQKDLYQVVLEAQRQALAAVRPGNSWDAPQEACVRVITEGLVQLGILRGDVDTLIEEQAYSPFYMHHYGHWLGLDVHDAGSYRTASQWRSFAPGMVTTVEPGIYIAAEDGSLAEHWRGMGIRIEDDVLVTPKGCRVLSDQAPREVADIEALMGGES